MVSPVRIRVSHLTEPLFCRGFVLGGDAFRLHKLVLSVTVGKYRSTVTAIDVTA